MGDVRRDFVFLLDVDSRLRILIDLVPFLLVLSIVFNALGRGGEKEGRFRLAAAGGICRWNFRVLESCAERMPVIIMTCCHRLFSNYAGHFLDTRNALLLVLVTCARDCT